MVSAKKPIHVCVEKKVVISCRFKQFQGIDKEDKYWMNPFQLLATLRVQSKPACLEASKHTLFLWVSTVGGFLYWK